MGTFDEVADRYEAWYETPLGRAVDEAERKTFLRVLEPKVGELVLEVGAGTGHWTRWFRQGLGMKVVGLELSEGMLAVARRRLPEVPFVRGDGRDLPFRGESFDAVVAITVLEFVPEPRRVLDEMWRCVRPGGRMVVGVLHSRSPFAKRRREEARKGHTVFSDAHFFEYEELLKLLRPYGPVRIRGCIHFPPSAWGVRLSWAFELFGKFLHPRGGAFLVGTVSKGLKAPGACA